MPKKSKQLSKDATTRQRHLMHKRKQKQAALVIKIHAVRNKRKLIPEDSERNMTYHHHKRRKRKRNIYARQQEAKSKSCRNCQNDVKKKKNKVELQKYPLIVLNFLKFNLHS